jgi:hypothetical protein
MPEGEACPYPPIRTAREYESFRLLASFAGRKLFDLTEVENCRSRNIRRLVDAGAIPVRREGKFLMPTAKKALRFGRNPIPINPVGPAVAIRARAIRQRKSGASIEAPSG